MDITGAWAIWPNAHCKSCSCTDQCAMPSTLCVCTSTASPKNPVTDIRLCQTILKHLRVSVVCGMERDEYFRLGSAMCAMAPYSHFHRTYTIGKSGFVHLHYTKQSPIKVDFKWNNLKFRFWQTPGRLAHKLPRKYVSLRKFHETLYLI